MAHQSIRRRLLNDQILVILLLGGGILATTFFGTRQAFQNLSETVVERAADQAEGRLRRFFEPVTTGLLALRSWGERGLVDVDDPRSLRQLLLPVAERLPHISGALIADEEGNESFLRRGDGGWRSRLTRPAEWGGRSQWLDWSSGEPVESFEELDYDPRTRPWFEGALARSREGDGVAAIHWTEPYRFFTDGSPGITASIAFDTADGGRRVAAFDVLLDDLVRYSRAIPVSERGGLWIQTADRRLLGWPDSPALWQGRDPAEALLEKPGELGLRLVDDAAEAVAEVPAAKRAEPVRFSSGGEVWWALGRQFELSDERLLSIAVTVPRDDLIDDREKLRMWIIGLTLAVLALAVARAATLAGRFSRPIEALASESDRMSQGDLEPGRAIPTKLAEVHQLTAAHERMRRGLKTLMKLERDLQLARQIQQATFPNELPRVAGFDLVAWSEPADETGGDSYDVIGLDAEGGLTTGDAERAVLLLADATGHGIGPALSVTQLRSMLRMAVRAGSGLAEVASHVNEQLCADLPGNRFITAWLAELNAASGRVVTFSAGQAPLLLYRAESDKVEDLNADAPPLGLLAGLPMVLPPPITLKPGDVYVVLSDGFFESVDAADMEFGKERVIGLIRQHRRAGSAEMLAAIRAALTEFTGNAPADDDRTAVIVKRLLA
ncbi:MAG: SpoIIE family protein phosphatase [bacterium]|nr:SpoIIE family protein phosphatase [bacterium]